MNTSETRKETVEIFNEAIVELDKYGLLGGLSVKQAQKLVTGRFKNNRMMKVLEEIYSRQKRPLDVDENRLCLIAGMVDGFDFFFFNILHDIMWNQLLIVLLSIFGLGAFIIIVMMMPIYFLMFAIDFLNPICIGRIIRSIGRCSGTVVTFGLNGLKVWKNEMIGATHNWWDFPAWAIGFSGLKLQILHENQNVTSIFLGFALRVKIESEIIALAYGKNPARFFWLKPN